MPNCTALTDLFPKLKRRQIELSFDGGDVTSDAGLLLLQRIDQHLKLTERVAPHLPDDRDPSRVIHSSLRCTVNHGHPCFKQPPAVARSF